jgi:hypothetical protein
MDIKLSDLQNALGIFTTEEVKGTQTGEGALPKTQPGDITDPPAQPGSGNIPMPPMPKMSPAAAAIALQMLNSKIFEEFVTFQSSATKASLKDIETANIERLEKIKEHFEHLREISENKKCGFFGFFVALADAFSSGDFEELGEIVSNSIGQMFKDLGTLIGAGIAIAVAALATGVTGGAASAALGLAIAATVLLVSSMVLSDPLISQKIVEAMPEDMKKNGGLALQITAMALAIIGSALSLGSSAAGAVPSAAMKVASTVTNLTSGLVGAGFSVADGVKGYQSAEHQEQAIRADADKDRIEANMAKLQTMQQASTADMRAFADAMAKALEEFMAVLEEYGKLAKKAASV